MAKQLLHLVLGGELSSLDNVEFRDLGKVDVVGVFPNYAKARDAWKAASQATVDNAHMRYFVVHLHRLLDPNDDHDAPKAAKPAPRKAAPRAKAGAKSGGKGGKPSKRR